MIPQELKPEVRNAFSKLRKDPICYFKNVLGVESLETYQRHVIKTVAENERVAIAACHDVGKSFLMARIAMWFLNTHRNSKVITTAPTYNQVERILWSEIRAAHLRAKFPLGGTLNLTEWKHEPEWFAVGFTPRNELTGGEGQGTSSSFQGFHAPGGLMVVFDEATGIPPNIWTMAEGLLTQHKVKFVAIGNPTSAQSEFYKCFKDPAWAKVYLSCFDSPNLIANNITTLEALKEEIEKVKSMSDDKARKYLDSYKVVKPYLLVTKWVVQSAMKWGIDHPLTVSKILGKFPRASHDTLVSLDFIEAAQARTYEPVATDRKIIGADIARFGSDSTELTYLHGKQQFERRAFYKFDEIEVTGEIINLSKEIGGADIIVVDETGLGGGVVTLLKDAVKNGALPKNCEIRGTQWGARASDAATVIGDEDREKYFNLKAKLFGLLQKDLKDSDGLCLIEDSVYLEELPTIRYRYNQKGQLVIESKDEYKKRTGRSSPDRADSLALANFGRYDDLNVGAFTKDFTQTKRQTFSGSMKSGREW